MDEAQWLQVVRQAGASMGALDAAGKLMWLDSLTAIDFIVEIERISNIEIPSEALRVEAFVSLEQLAKALAAVAA